jgi:hypothetical protein
LHTEAKTSLRTSAQPRAARNGKRVATVLPKLDAQINAIKRNPGFGSWVRVDSRAPFNALTLAHGRPNAGRAKLRLSRGFPVGLA